MLIKQEVDAEISELENRENHNASAVARLASLYTIRDHMDADPAQDYVPFASPFYERTYSQAAAPSEDILGAYGDSEFLQAIAGKSSAAVWLIIDDLMATLKVVNGKVYDSVMRKIRQI